MPENRQIISLYENTEQLLTTAIDKIVVDIFNKKKDAGKAQIVLMTGCSPLAGTTSTAISLSIAMANTGRRTLLIDCDLRKALKYKKLNEQAKRGLAEYLLQADEMPQDAHSHNSNRKRESGTSVSGSAAAMMDEDCIYYTNIENLDYIPCGSHIENATRMLCSSRMTDLLKETGQRYECIILDMPSVNIVPDAQILFDAADGIILMAALGETRKKQIKEAKRKVVPYADKYYGMIVNKVQLDMYRFNVRDYDYYFVGKDGEQKLRGSAARRKYKKSSVGKNEGGK